MSSTAMKETSSTDTVRRADEVLASTYRRPPVVFVGGEGSWLHDAEGRRYLDFTSGICVNALGHAAPEVMDTLREHAGGLIHVSNLFHTEPAVALADELVRRSFAHAVFFSNSGAEANEAAVKFARLRGGPHRRTIVWFSGSFHGRTLGTLAATDRPDIRTPFAPLPSGYRRAEWNDHDALETVDDATAAAIVEPIQGEAGVRVPDPEWLAALRRRCDEVGACLIFDEVQTGLGRCGHLWAHEGFGILPDIMTLAKPLGGGLPIGATLLAEHVAREVRPGSHATTFGGGPLVTRVALEVLRSVAREELLATVRVNGERLRGALTAVESPLVEEVRGRGLLMGVKVRNPAEVLAAALDEKLLLAAAGDRVLRFVPPLTVSEREIDEAVARFQRSLRRAESEASS